MEQDLKKIVEQLNERVRQAEQKAQQILKEAQETADKIIEEAKQEAQRIKNQSQQELEKQYQAHQVKLEQAVRDTLIALKNSTIQSILRKSIDSAILSLTRDPEFIKQAVLKVISCLDEETQNKTFQAYLGEEDYEKLKDQLIAEAHDAIAGSLEIKPDPNIASGFKISFKGSNYYYDFTDQALLELFSTMYGKQIEQKIFNQE